MKPPNSQWEELPDGNLKLVYHDLHADADIIIVVVEERKPKASSRVRLIMRHKETGAEAQWANSETGFITPRELSLGTAMQRGVQQRLNPAWLLRIGIDYYPRIDRWVEDWERDAYKFGRP